MPIFKAASLFIISIIYIQLVHAVDLTYNFIELIVMKEMMEIRHIREFYPSIQSQSKQFKRTAQSIPDTISYLLMRERFDQIYQHVERISSRDKLRPRYNEKMQKKELPYLGVMKQFCCGGMERDASTLLAVKEEHPSKRQMNDKKYISQRKGFPSKQINKQSRISEANNLTVIGAPGQNIKINKQGSTQANQYVQYQVMRNTRYKKKLLSPLRKIKMSNNIRDYLSVQKIPLRVEDQNLTKQTQQIQQEVKQRLKSKTTSPVSKKIDPVFNHFKHQSFKPRVIKFKDPFELYSYRDLLWKVGYSNKLIVSPPQDYECKIKVYVGPGNNSNLIRGIIRRRPWYSETDKITEAQFIWTQIKVIAIFNTQKISVNKLQIFPLDQNKKQSKNSVLNKYEFEHFELYWKKNIDKQRKMKPNMRLRTKQMNQKQYSFIQVKNQIRMHNHLTNNFIIGNKKALFRTMSEYYSAVNQEVFNNLPLTFHIKNGLQDDEYLKFLQHYYSIAKQNKSQVHLKTNKHNVWIVKPGQNTNRGNGITVCLDLNEIKGMLRKKQKHFDGTIKTYILQKYIERPLLYKKRKFDLRHYLMMNCSNGIIKGYWYKEGYVRTTSSQYTLKLGSGSVHLTNDAVQKHLPDYGKYEKGNKISYQELNTYLQKHDSSFDFWTKIYPRLKKIGTDTIRASAQNIDPARRKNNFQIFGLDFMIDQDYNVWLIEVNTNPCLQTTCPVLAKIIPRMIECTFQICLDPIFIPPLSFIPKCVEFVSQTSNGYELVFDERVDELKPIGEIIQADNDEEDVFEDDGEDFVD